MSFKILQILLILLLFCGFSSPALSEDSPISIGGILGAIDEDAAPEEGSVEADVLDKTTGSIPAVIELGLVLSDEFEISASIRKIFPNILSSPKPRASSIMIGSHRLGPQRTFAAWTSKFKIPSAENIRRLLYTAYDMFSQLDMEMDVATIILTIIGEIIKEIISEIVEKLIDGVLTALELPPVIKEIIATIIGEIIATFIIDPLVDELIGFITDAIN